MKYLSKIPRAVWWAIAVVFVSVGIGTCDALTVKWMREHSAENADHNQP